jgi:signal transduction histidine kinase
MKIAFPSIENQRSYEEQNNLYKEAAESLKLAKAKELGLQSVIDTMKAEYINIVRTRKHDMMPYMRELGSVSRSLRGYVDKYGSEVLQSKVASLLTQFESAYKGLSALIEIFSQEEEYGVPERVNIDKYLVDFIGNLYDEHSGFSVDYYCDDNALRAYGLQVSLKAAALYVDIAPLDLDRIVRNITDNAIEHGFTDPERKDYQINIILSIVPEKDMFQIDFSNNGSPLPKGMDKEKYGLLGEKAGKTGKTGQGGYIVKSIVEHYHGDYDVFMEGENTVVRILLPISKTNE